METNENYVSWSPEALTRKILDQKAGIIEMDFENASLKSNRKWERIITHPIYLIIIIFLIFKTCDGDKKIQAYEKNEKELKAKIANLEDSIQNQKAIPIIVEKSGINTIIGAIIVPKNDSRPETITIRSTIKKVPYEVEVPVVVPDSLLMMKLKNCLNDNEQAIGVFLELDSLLNNPIKICLEKEGKDSVQTLYEQQIHLKEFLQKSPPAVNYLSVPYMEYQKNPYRIKTERSFKRAIISGIFSAGLYGTSTLIGPAIFIDGRNNSGARKTHNKIRALEIGSTAFGLYSGFELCRTVYFHFMEGKFIVGPNKIGLTINLEKK